MRKRGTAQLSKGNIFRIKKDNLVLFFKVKITLLTSNPPPSPFYVNKELNKKQHSAHAVTCKN